MAATALAWPEVWFQANAVAAIARQERRRSAVQLDTLAPDYAHRDFRSILGNSPFADHLRVTKVDRRSLEQGGTDRFLRRCVIAIPRAGHEKRLIVKEQIVPLRGTRVGHGRRRQWRAYFASGMPLVIKNADARWSSSRIDGV